MTYIDEAVQTRVNTNPTGTASWNSYYHVQDANFNDLGIVDGSGNLAERYEYDSYGNRRVFFSPGVNDPGCYAPTLQSVKVVTSGSVVQPYGINEIGFQGLMDDEQTNLGYARNRYTNFTLGRWNSTDPLGYIASNNLYDPEGNSPTETLDSNGTCPPCVIAAVAILFLLVDNNVADGPSVQTKSRSEAMPISQRLA